MKSSWFQLLSLAALTLVEKLDGVLYSARSLLLAEPPPFELAFAVDGPVRRDLLQGQMPEQPAPTERVTRVQRDQRPQLLEFLVPRNNFAF